MKIRSTNLLTLSAAIHSKTFWLAVVGAAISVVVALGVPLTSAQSGIIESAVAIIISAVLGGSAVSYAHAKSAAELAKTEVEPK